jgi:hypothetical protein
MLLPPSLKTWNPSVQNLSQKICDPGQHQLLKVEWTKKKHSCRKGHSPRHGRPAVSSRSSRTL